MLALLVKGGQSDRLQRQGSTIWCPRGIVVEFNAVLVDFECDRSTLDDLIPYLLGCAFDGHT